MANFVLDKGFLVQGTAAAVSCRFAGFGTVDWSIDLTPTAGAAVAGVVMENVDAAKVTTGKVIANVRMLGIAPVKLGTGGISRGAAVTTDATGLGVAATTANIVAGVALETGVEGDIVNVLLSYGGIF